MIKRSRRVAPRLLLAALLGALSLCAAARDATPPTPLLWKVSDADNSVYLLGTFHLLRADDYPLDARIDAAFADAETLVLELPPAELTSPALGAQFAMAGLREDGRTLSAALGAADWARLQAAAGGLGLPEPALEQMDAWFVALALSLQGLSSEGLDPALGLDRHLAERAAQAGKRTRGLETAAEQIALFDTLPEATQLAQLRDALARAGDGSTPIEARRLHAQWRAGDADALYTGLAAEMRQSDPAFYARMNTDRNAAWAIELRALLDGSSSDDALVAVGSLHLLGPEGLVQRLEALGYRVQRL